MSFSLSLSPCAALVRSHDYDRYLCCLFAPERAREAWFTLFAFNHEIAAIPEAVSEQMIGFMRFAWWREALDEIVAKGPVRRHPVVQALAEAMNTHALDRKLFDAMLDAREAAFAGDGFTVASEWEEYFRATCASLFRLCAQSAGVTETAGLNELGVAWAATGTARVCRQSGDEGALALMTGIAEDALRKMQPVPAPFTVFADAVAFYLKRLKTGKDAGHRARLPLTITLCWRQFLRHCGIIKINK